MIELSLVKITWLDATDIDTGWHTLLEIKEKTLVAVESVGWLLEENDQKLVLVGCLDRYDENAGRGIIIPKPWITKREELAVKQNI
jgi:hypothetical protein